MSWIAVVAFDGAGRVTKYQPTRTEADAQSHVDRAIASGLYPDAFVSPRPVEGGVSDWTVSGGTLIFDPPPAPPHVPVYDTAALIALLVSKGVITTTEARSIDVAT